MRELIETITPWFAEWGLLIVFVATLVESSVIVASVFPGETVLLLGGFFASPNALLDSPVPPLDLPSVVFVAFAGAVIGDVLGYLIGRIAGRSIVRRFGRFFFLPERRLPVLERYFLTYGRRAIVLGRFAPFLRSIRTLVAGTAQMPFWRFFVPDAIGAAAWAAAMASTGFLLGESWHVAERYLGAGGGVVFLLLLVLFVVTWRRVRRRVERDIAEAVPEAGREPQVEAPNSPQ